MPDELRLAGACVGAFAASLLLTPLAIRAAIRLDFHDLPNVDYKRHRPPTPYLGGSAVLLAFVAAALLFGGGAGDYWLIVAGAGAMWLVGTIDDRRSVTPIHRLALEAVLGVVLWSSGLGWDLFGVASLDLAVTVVWLIAVINACNLLDNMDGSAGTVISLCSAGVAAAALVEGVEVLAALCLALSAACWGFLPFNLRPPARIYLGDGGSMPLGFVLAASVMALPTAADSGLAAVFAAGALVAVPLTDTALVVVSRRRRGISLLTGGRDHSTHRLAKRFGSTLRASLVLGAVQVLASALAVAGIAAGAGAMVAAGSLVALAAIVAIVMLESRSWAIYDGAPSERSHSIAPAEAVG